MDDIAKYLTDEQFKDYLTFRLYENFVARGATLDGKLQMRRAVELYEHMKKLQREPKHD